MTHTQSAQNIRLPTGKKDDLQFTVQTKKLSLVTKYQFTEVEVASAGN